MKYSSYYQAHITPKKAWFFVAILRSFEHLCFDRTFSVKDSIFEFFVPEDFERFFLEIMSYFQHTGVVVDLKKLPNRLKDPEATV
jgi:hypothetical protein